MKKLDFERIEQIKIEKEEKDPTTVYKISFDKKKGPVVAIMYHLESGEFLTINANEKLTASELTKLLGWFFNENEEVEVTQNEMTGNGFKYSFCLMGKNFKVGDGVYV